MFYPLGRPKRTHFLLLLVLVIQILIYQKAVAQHQISGKVVDVNQKPIDRTMVSLMNEGRFLGYAQTDALGLFKLTLKSLPDSAQLKFSKLGYAVQHITFDKHKTNYLIQLKEQAITLKEVIVKPPIFKSGDTISYSVKDFQNVQDRTIGDILKKLPGIEVKENGAVLYNGKGINNFFIENMNLLKEKYGIAVKNISPKDVETVEILENNQSVKALQGVEFTDRAAVNLKLKDAAKVKWIGNLFAASGVSPLLGQLELVGMSFKAKNQSINTLKYNNTGIDILKEQESISVDDFLTGKETVIQPYDVLQIPISTPPLKQESYLFNQSVVNSINYLKVLSSNDQLRMNSSFIFDRKNFNQNQLQQFIINPEKNIFLKQSFHSTEETQKGELSLEWTRNIKQIYLNHRFQAVGKLEQSTMDMKGTLGNTQRAILPMGQLVNQTYIAKVFDRRVFKINNLQQFSFQPQDLNVNFDASNLAMQQIANHWVFKSNTNLSFSFPLGPISFDQKLGFSYQWNRMESKLSNDPNINTSFGAASLKSVKGYYQPKLSLKFNSFNVHIRSPAYYLITKLQNRSQTWFILNPSMNINYQINAYWETSIMSGLNRNMVNFMQVYPYYFRSNYSVLQKGMEQLALSKSGNVDWRLSYNNPIAYSNIIFSASHSPVVNPFISTLRFNGFFSVREWFWMRNEMANTKFKMTARKTFTYLGLTIGSAVEQLNTNSNLMQMNELQKFTTRSTRINPEIRWQNKHTLNVHYEGVVQRNVLQLRNTAEKKVLWQQQHTLTLGYIPTQKFNVRVSSDFFKNEVTAGNFASAFFLNVETRYILKNNWEWSLMARNITGQRKFEQQIFSINQINTNNFVLRPLNVLLACYYKF